MEEETFYFKMAGDIQENFQKIHLMVQEYSFGLMGEDTKAIGRKACKKGKEYTASSQGRY